jgi:hypothetical protein
MCDTKIDAFYYPDFWVAEATLNKVMLLFERTALGPKILGRQFDSAPSHFADSQATYERKAPNPITKPIT